jgi:hypothetical protein
MGWGGVPWAQPCYLPTPPPLPPTGREESAASLERNLTPYEVGEGREGADGASLRQAALEGHVTRLPNRYQDTPAFWRARGRLPTLKPVVMTRAITNRSRSFNILV